MVVAVLIPDGRAGEEYALFIETAVRALEAKHGMHRFCFIAAAGETGTNPQWIRKPHTRNRLSRWWWYHLQLPRLLKKLGAAVFLATEGSCSMRTRCPQCLLLPHTFFGSSEKNSGHPLPGAGHVRKAGSVAVFSESLKTALQQRYRLPAEKICIVPAAVAAPFRPLDDREVEMVRDRIAAGTAYFLCTGLREPDTLLVVLKAFSQFKRRQKSNMKLVVPVADLEFAPMNRQLEGYRFRHDVVLVPSIPAGEEPQLYGAAYAVVHVSDSGTETIKAVQCAVPVITVAANRPLMKEAALYYEEELAEQLMLVYKDESLRKRLIENGRDLRSLYSWENCTDRLWQCMTAAINK